MQARECWMSVWLVACHGVVFVCEGAQCSDALLMYQIYHDLCLGGSACLLSMACSCQIIETTVIFCVCAQAPKSLSGQ